MIVRQEREDGKVAIRRNLGQVGQTQWNLVNRSYLPILHTRPSHALFESLFLPSCSNNRLGNSETRHMDEEGTHAIDPPRT